MTSPWLLGVCRPFSASYSIINAEILINATYETHGVHCSKVWREAFRVRVDQVKMPLPKRLVVPVHISRGSIPEDYPLPSELEAATNGTLANTVRQLSSLSQHSEDLFGELARECQQIYDRTNSLQARIDRLAIKATQLDSAGEEVSLQDIHKRKAFKSAVVFDQQIFARNTMPSAMLEMYQSCDKPPPLDKLNVYRDDGKDGLKFYTDPNYFFELWKQEMLNDTMKAIQGNKRIHRSRGSQGPENGRRHKKPVRAPHKTIERQRQIVIGHGEVLQQVDQPPQQHQLQQQHLLPQQHPMGQMQYGHATMEDPHLEQRPNRPNSIEILRSYPQEVPDGMHSPVYRTYEENPYQQGGMYAPGQLSNEAIYQPGTPTRKLRPSQPPPAPPSNQSTPSAANTPTRGRSMSTGRDNLPPPPPPPDTTMSPPNGIPPHLARQSSQSRSNSPHSHQQTPEPQLTQELPPPPSVPKQASPPKQATPIQAPPPPPPPPMPLMANGPASPPPVLPLQNGDLAKILNSTPPKLTPPKERAVQRPAPMVDPRNDLLKQIRVGIKLRKVEKIEQKEMDRGDSMLNDVASILRRRRIDFEYSDSDDSESGSDGEWSENETSA